jgi:hypothetical protein
LERSEGREKSRPSFLPADDAAFALWTAPGLGLDQVLMEGGGQTSS